MRAWWDLYKREINSITFFSSVVMLLTFAWELFLFYKIDKWPMGLPFGLSFLPLSFFPLLILWLGYNSFRQEWKDDTNYFIISLPRHGWEISLAKLAAGMTFYTLASFFTLILIYFFHQSFIRNTLEEITVLVSEAWIVNNLVKAYLVFWLMGLAIYIVTQFSQLISLFYDRFRGFITVIVFILANYIIFRGGSILAPALKWLPDFPVHVFNDTMAGLQEFTVYLGSGPLVGSALIIIGMFFTGSWLLEHYLEV
jgi:ABC-type transport system involved in multi-copper enzyme maturation permease subunit